MPEIKNNVETKKQVTFKLGELFSGPGGIGYAAKQSIIESREAIFSIKHEWANDFDKDTCQTYIKNICPENGVKVYCQDVKKLDFNKLTPIDALAFGFPCNDFSVVGEQLGMNGAYGPLYSYGIKALKKFQPKFFLAENVGGLRNVDDGKALNYIMKKLESCGYNVVAHFYKFEKYGVPQARHRIIFIGIRNDLKMTFKVPAPTVNTPVTSRMAIEEPPIAEDSPNHDFIKQSNIVIERLKHIRPGENAFNAIMPDNLKLNVKGAKLSHIYKRLNPEKPAYTITGSGGGGTHVYHWSENRALTNRERARLQTFPDDFIFVGSKESVRKQIGMAVPPKAAKIIFDSVLKCFAGIHYESIEPNMNLKAIIDDKKSNDL